MRKNSNNIDNHVNNEQNSEPTQYILWRITWIQFDTFVHCICIYIFALKSKEPRQLFCCEFVFLSVFAASQSLLYRYCTTLYSIRLLLNAFLLEFWREHLFLKKNQLNRLLIFTSVSYKYLCAHIVFAASDFFIHYHFYMQSMSSFFSLWVNWKICCYKLCFVFFFCVYGNIILICFNFIIHQHPTNSKHWLIQLFYLVNKSYAHNIFWISVMCDTTESTH